MVLSANENLPPNKATAGQPPPTFLQSNKSWACILRGNVKTFSNGLGHNKTQPGQFASYSERPFLKGTIPGSILIDITSVTNKLLFVHELSASCGGDENLWSVENIIRRDSNKNFVEITAFLTFREELTTVGVSLPSFEKRFFGYPSLSPDSNLVSMVDPKEVYRIYAMISGVYSGRGYAVLATTGDSALTHALDWKYRCLFADDSEDPVETSVEVYATWDSMAPYCRYCHASDHAFADCPKKKSKISCYNCNEARKTPSTMSPNARSTPTEHLAETSPLLTEQPVDPEDPVSAVPTAPAEDRSASLIPGKNTSKYAKFTTIMTRSKTDSRPTSTATISDEPSVPTTTGCNSCHCVGHKTHRSTSPENRSAFTIHDRTTPVVQNSTPATSMLDPEVIFSLALLGIWRSHWLFVFNGIPFVASPVTQNICRSISVAVQENCVKQGQAHRALPFFSID
ncbi:hypothetical protein G6F70_006705 [Rhizopus microsporus]|nr:hypothetical protein G6F71_006674 [Rhizopus microsporus]KAG1197341.1 hypothetical protein G6F70_006705 [Rhizopus microsporus]